MNLPNTKSSHGAVTLLEHNTNKHDPILQEGLALANLVIANQTCIHSGFTILCAEDFYDHRDDSSGSGHLN